MLPSKDSQRVNALYKTLFAVYGFRTTRRIPPYCRSHAATGFWSIAAYTTITHDDAPPAEFWTVTSSDKNRTHPTLVRAAVPRSLTSAQSAYLVRREMAQLATP
jgi:hypothetical protein